MYLHTEGTQTKVTIDQTSITLSFIPTKNILREAKEIYICSLVYHRKGSCYKIKLAQQLTLQFNYS